MISIYRLCQEKSQQKNSPKKLVVFCLVFFMEIWKNFRRNHRMLCVEGTFRGHLDQPPGSEQGHLHISLLLPDLWCYEIAGSGSKWLLWESKPWHTDIWKTEVTLILAWLSALALAGCDWKALLKARALLLWHAVSHNTNNKRHRAGFLTCSVEVCRGYSPRLYHWQGAETEETPAKLQRIPSGAWIIFWSERLWGREGGRYAFAEQKPDLSSITNVPCWARKPNTDHVKLLGPLCIEQALGLPPQPLSSWNSKINILGRGKFKRVIIRNLSHLGSQVFCPKLFPISFPENGTVLCSSLGFGRALCQHCTAFAVQCSIERTRRLKAEVS